MCKAKDEGPRCSNGGRIRYERADRYQAKVKAKADAEMARRGELSPHTQWQVENAERRMYQASVVRNATPAGWKQLEAERDIEERRLVNIKKKGTAPGTPGRTKRISCERKIARLNQLIEKGQRDREIMRKNKAILEPGEKKAIRDKMIAQGAEINSRAQRASAKTAAQQKDLSQDKPLELKSWTRDDVSDLAPHWVEDRTRTGWKANPAPRSKTKGERFAPTESNALRMNTPDGMVSEVRVDVHSIKTAAGKYAIEVRRASSSTNLQSSPYDTTGGKLGSILGSGKGQMARSVVVETKEFNTQAEATSFAKKVKASQSQRMAVDLAVESREALVRWAAKGGGTEGLMKQRQAGRHLYSEPFLTQV